jgi:hypothetical protein
MLLTPRRIGSTRFGKRLGRSDGSAALTFSHSNRADPHTPLYI